MISTKDKNDLEKYSHDASIFSITPEVVYFPENVDEIKKLVNEVRECKRKKKNSDLSPALSQGKGEMQDTFDNKDDGKEINKEIKSSGNISITSRAAGTDMSGGPINDSIILSFTEKFNKIISVNKEKKEATFQLGVFYRDLEKALDKEDLIFPSYPASKNLCAMGGIVANNSGGEKTLRYGKTLEYVRSIKMICTDGEEYEFKKFAGSELDEVLKQDNLFGQIHREILNLIKENLETINKNRPTVTKNSSGYYLWEAYSEKENSLDLSKIICGSQGTLGIMTEATLGLVEKVKYSEMLVFMLKDWKDLPLVSDLILPHLPESCEIYDDHTFRVAMRYFWTLIKNMSKSGNIFKTAFQFLPELKMVLTGGVPKIILLAEFTGNDGKDLRAKAENLLGDMKKTLENKIGDKSVQIHLANDDAEREKYWTFRRESFNLLRSKMKNLRTAPFIEDVVVPAKDLSSFIPKFEELLDKHKMIYTIAGHLGDGNIHVIPLMDFKNKNIKEDIKNISSEVYKMIGEYHGSLSGEHNDGLVRTPFLNDMFDKEMISLFEKTKNIFDPLNIFNPKKKVHSTWADVEKYIV